MLKFQFQYGSIKSKIYEYYSHNAPEFQFQYGSIKRDVCKSDEQPYVVFQFQYGSIKSLISLNKPLKGKFVSIPIWFD